MKSTLASASPGTPATGTRIQSVARASQLLLWVASQEHGASVKEISESQGLGLPTTYHIINTLLDQGFLSRNGQRRYVLGESAAILAQAYLRTSHASERLIAGLRELAVRTHETVYLADWGDRDIRVRASVESSQVVRVGEVPSGTYEHGHARANGKVLLACASEEVRRDYLSRHPLVPLTPNTITNEVELAKELERIRRRGLAYDAEEYAMGVSCMAAPLLLNGEVIASYGISVPTERFKRTKKELKNILLEVVDSISTPARSSA
jgi:IclR family transcriptional regulator, acetate operon repressor